MFYTIKGKIVFLPAEVKNRDWFANLFLADYFLQKGYHVVVGMLWKMDDYIFNANHAVYVCKDFYKYEIEKFSKIKKNNNFLAGYDAEGLIYEDDKSYIASQLNKESLLLQDMIITWGNRQKETIQKVVTDNTNIYALGNHRLDLLRHNLVQKLYRTHSEYITGKYGENFILINSNFNCITRFDYDPKQSSFSVNGKNEISAKRLDYYEQMLSELFPKFLHMIGTLADKFPQKIIVVRPHPAEKIEYWQNALHQYTNVYIDKSFTVQPWLFHAGVVIHSGCTTALEGVLMGKVVLSYLPDLSIKYRETLPDQVSKQIKTEDEMETTVQHVFGGTVTNTLTDEQKTLIDYYLSFDAKVTCSENIVKYIDNFYKGNGNFVYKPESDRLVRKRDAKRTSRNFNVEFGYVTLDECRSDFKNIHDAIGAHFDYSIQQLSDNEFIILNETLHEKKLNIRKTMIESLLYPIGGLIKQICAGCWRWGKQKILKPLLKPIIVKIRRKIERVEINRLLSIMDGQPKKENIHFIEKKLSRFLKFAYQNVPYWKQFNFLKSINTKNVFALYQKLPPLSKDIIRTNGEAMWRIGQNQDNHSVGYTGGTTGVPLVFLCGHAPEETHQKALYEYMIGERYYGSLDKPGALVSFDGTKPKEQDIQNNIFWTENQPNIYGSYHFCSFYLSASNAHFYIKKLNELKPVVLRGYSNAILSLAQYAAMSDEPVFTPKAVYVTSEYCSEDSMRYISNAFHCPCFGQYGQAEGLLFAWTKPNSSEYYCSPLYGFVEVLNDQNEQVKEGELGEVTVTGFYTHDQPFIRYRTGDKVIYGGSDNGIVRLSNLLGRNNDYIVDRNGNKIMLSGYIDIHYFSCRDKIYSYQIEQKEKGLIVFRLVTRNDWTKQDEYEIRTRIELQNIDVLFEYVTDIPLTERGKRKNIIQYIIL